MSTPSQNRFRRERPDFGCRIERIADLERSHSLHKFRDKLVVNPIRQDEALRGDAGLAGIDRPRRHPGLDRRFEIGARHDDERVAAAQFENTLLDLARGGARHFAAGAFAAGQRHGFHARIVDQAPRLFRLDEQRLKNAFLESGSAKNIFDRQGALRNVRRVFEQADIARHQRRRGETEHLPEGKIPRHDREHGADWLVTHITAPRVGRNALIGEKALGVLRVESATADAFRYLLDSCAQELSHFERDDPREPFFFLLEQLGGGEHPLRALGERRSTMLLESGGSLRQLLLDLRSDRVR